MNTHTPSMDFDLLSQPMQQRLQRRIAHHNGALGPVVEAVRAELAQLDADPEVMCEDSRRSYQAQRALLVAQLTYLDTIGAAQSADAQPQVQGFWSRFRRGQRTPVTE
jgi:small-conductance mechanosensitive channel